MLWVLKNVVRTQKNCLPKHMLKLTGKKIITIIVEFFFYLSGPMFTLYVFLTSAQSSSTNTLFKLNEFRWKKKKTNSLE